MSNSDIYALVAMLTAKASKRLPRHPKAMEILEGWPTPLSECSPEVEAQVPALRPATRHNISENSARVYQREDAVMKLVDVVYKHFDDHNDANDFLNQPLSQLGGMSPLAFVACDKTVAEAMRYVGVSGARKAKRTRTRG